jgi:hypothetical protein
MTLRRDPGADRRLYLEDLHVGQRFVSRSVPLEYADTEPGAQIVDDLLGRIEQGTPV